MQTKIIVAGAALALAASSLSVSAAEKNPPVDSNAVDFVVLVGVPVELLGVDELATTRGAEWWVVTPRIGEVVLPDGPFSNRAEHGKLNINPGEKPDFQITNPQHTDD